MTREFTHLPVMLTEVLEAIDGTPSLPIIDATLGGAGHSRAILDRFPTRVVCGLDQDPEAVAVATERLASYGDRAHVVHARFDEITRVALGLGIGAGDAAAVLFDLGVSSPQLDTTSRGFSYQNEGPLDMRMDTTRGLTAAAFIDAATEEKLSDLFYLHGETKFSRRIARAMVAQRPFHTTTEVADLVAGVIPIPARRRGHPAKRVFQALRVAVNEELDVLGPALDSGIELLAPGGRIIVLAYHSGEDKIAKDRLRFHATGGCECPPSLPCVCGAVPTVRLLNRGARKATSNEIAANPRAESVRLRVAERLDSTSRVVGAR